MPSRPTRRSPLALTVLSLLHYKPLHPYGIQRLIKDWGKDQVVNVGERTGLYRTMDRLRDAGLISARDTDRDRSYPERTTYEVTEAGRAVAHEWVTDMLATPRAEYPEFPVALSNLLLLDSGELLAALRQRARTLTRTATALTEEMSSQGARGLPRIVMLDSEYTAAMTRAELTWTEEVIADLESGRLAWDAGALKAFAAALE